MRTQHIFSWWLALTGICLGLYALAEETAPSAYQTGAALIQSPPLPVPGGIALLNIRGDSAQPPYLSYHGERVLVIHDGGQWWAVVGISLNAEPGLHEVVDHASGARYAFEVSPKEYEKDYITLNNQRQVNPNAQDLKRINRETALIKAALDQPWQAWTQAPALPLAQPIAGRISGVFGKRRYFNKQPRKPHSGLDIAAPQGTPVPAPAAGRVVATGDYFFNGKTVFLDHGQGLLTMYCHLHAISVQPGQTMQAGDLLGQVGMSGRATGPHLHWGVQLNGTWVDPSLLAGFPATLSRQ
jgi:murein DD-endopeptidase MepM/ murein hydrolase activator NlpD